MTLTEWSADTLQYDLSDEYSIRLADVTEWGLFCTIYYDMGYVGFFREEEFSSSRCSAYWIYRGESKIGSDLNTVVTFGHKNEKQASVRWGLWHMADHNRYHQAPINQLRKWFHAYTSDG